MPSLPQWLELTLKLLLELQECLQAPAVMLWLAALEAM
jgi:hypothetical protein